MRDVAASAAACRVGRAVDRRLDRVDRTVELRGLPLVVDVVLGRRLRRCRERGRQLLAGPTAATVRVAHCTAVKAASSSAVAVLWNVARCCSSRGLRAEPLAEVLRLAAGEHRDVRRSLRGRARAVPARARTPGSGWRRRRRWRGRGRRAHRSRGGGRRPRGRTCAASTASAVGAFDLARSSSMLRRSPASTLSSDVSAAGLRPALRERLLDGAEALTAASVRSRAPGRARHCSVAPPLATYHDDTTLSFWSARLASSSESQRPASRSPYCSCAWRAVKRSLKTGGGDHDQREERHEQDEQQLGAEAQARRERLPSLQASQLELHRVPPCAARGRECGRRSQRIAATPQVA